MQLGDASSQWTTRKCDIKPLPRNYQQSFTFSNNRNVFLSYSQVSIYYHLELFLLRVMLAVMGEHKNLAIHWTKKKVLMNSFLAAAKVMFKQSIHMINITINAPQNLSLVSNMNFSFLLNKSRGQNLNREGAWNKPNYPLESNMACKQLLYCHCNPTSKP